MKIVYNQTTLLSTTFVFFLFTFTLVGGYLYYDLIWMLVGAAFMLFFTVKGKHYILKKRLTANNLIIWIMLITMTLTWPFALYKTTGAIFHYGVGVLSIFAAYVISKHPNEACRSVGLTLFTIQGLTVAYLATTGHSVLPLDHIIENSSSNGITTVLIVLQAVYVGLLFHTHRTIPIISPIITLYICFEGFSRGSIISAAMINIIVFSILFFSTKSVYRYTALIPLLIAISLFIYIEYFEISLAFIVEESKFRQGIVDTARKEMYEDYFGKMNYLTLFTGTDYSNTSIMHHYGNNPHSSLIRAHHLFGILYVIAIFTSTTIAIMKAHSNHVLMVSSSLIIIIIFRALSEPVLFPTPMDFFFFLLLFVGNSFRNHPAKNKWILR